MAVSLLATTSLTVLSVGELQAQSWRLKQPDSIEHTGKLTSKRLGEASGAAESAVNDGVFWTITDSGNRPELYAVNRAGELLATIPIAGERNRDWEAVAVGRCGEQSCVYIGETGDNSERHKSVRILRLVEPKLDPGSELKQGAVSSTSLTFRYPDGPADVEAIAATPEGDLLLVTKGRTRGVRLYRLDASAWQLSGTTEATFIATLPINANKSAGNLVTGMTLDPAGRRMVVRTYRVLYLFDLSESARPTPANWTACDILGAEPQGEGVTWVGPWRLILISEKGLFKNGTVVEVECSPAPL